MVDCEIIGRRGIRWRRLANFLDQTICQCVSCSLSYLRLKFLVPGGPQVAKQRWKLISSDLRTWKTAPSSSFIRLEIISGVSVDLHISSSIIFMPHLPADEVLEVRITLQV